MDNQNPNPQPEPTPLVPAPQPVLTADAGAALLDDLRKLTAEMEANRTAIEQGFQQLADDLAANDTQNDDDPGTLRPILTTPAAQEHNQPAATFTVEEVERCKSGVPKRRNDESEENFLDRLRSLPPLDPPRRIWSEPKKVFEARRFDGTAGE